MLTGQDQVVLFCPITRYPKSVHGPCGYLLVQGRSGNLDKKVLPRKVKHLLPTPTFRGFKGVNVARFVVLGAHIAS